MPVTLEALAAKEGDALLLHFDDGTEPVLWVIDGGPAGVFPSALEVRLEEIRAERDLDDEEPLVIDFVNLSHVDRDHVVGLLDLFAAATDANGRRRYAFERVWHNSFDVLETAVDKPLTATVGDLGAAADGEVVVASIDQGRRLADLIRKAERDGNPPFDGLVVASKKPIKTGFGGAAVTVVAPAKARLDALADEWEKKVKQPIDRGDLAEVAAYVDKSVSNLSSIVLHVEVDGKTLLLTGDVRGDHLLEGLRTTKLLGSGAKATCTVDVLKVPHHGSDRNLEKEFFETVVADHYVLSSDGHDDNPSTDVLDWIVDTQGKRKITLHLTYAEANGAEAHLAERRKEAGMRFEVRCRDPRRPSIVVDLG